MDNSTDRYLHKKFKKQLSIDPIRIHNHVTSFNPIESNESVPIKIQQSTNRNETSVNLSVLNNEKSSISNILVTDKSTLNSNSSYRNIINSKSIEFDGNIRSSEQFAAHISNKVEPNTITTSSILNVSQDYYSVTNPEPKFVQPDHLPTTTDDANQTATGGERYGHQEKGTSSAGKYVCTYCNLACSKPSVLQKHIRAHTNERPYPCVSCGFSFKTRSNLYKHCRSRTHANRVMGNRAQEINTDDGSDNQIRQEQQQNLETINNTAEPMGVLDYKEQPVESDDRDMQEMYQKPYKPRFHTSTNSKYDYDNLENINENKGAVKSDLISLHINELINKNNTIINTPDPYLIKRRPSISDCMPPNTNNNDYNQRYETQHHNNSNQDTRSTVDEPLNLTKSRKRCLSEVTEPTTQKSLIKELLLKNLYADSNMQCPYCKMIFQTVTELELHKLRNCKGFTKTGPRYSRSSSVNVASILTQNKNAFDNIPHLQNTVFPLKSPGPFLGKTRLVDSDKSKSFSFDDCIENSHFQSNDILKNSKYSLSPLSIPYDKMKQPPVKLFGGEVKITQTSGETKSFRIDRQDDKYNPEKNYEYSGKLSENCVVKSTLQSGGTVLQNKQYVKHDNMRLSPETISVYENTAMSPSIDISNLEKTKFNYDYRHQDFKEHDDKLITRMLPNDEIVNGVKIDQYKYKNISDFSQNAVKLLTPNLKQLNLSIPGVPIPKFVEASSPLLTFSRNFERHLLPQTPIKIPYQPNDAEKDYFVFPSPINNNSFDGDTDMSTNNLDFAHKQILLQKNMSEIPKGETVCSPLNLLVNGKVVRYVPGMPGPVATELPAETPIVKTPLKKPEIMITPVESSPPQLNLINNFEKRGKHMDTLEIKLENNTRQIESPTKLKSPITTSLVETPRKFARPNSLALKPSMSSLKQHHGLTPTMFNQILISPDTPRGAKKYNEQFLHGNYFSYLGLKSSTKPVYCTLNKTQPFYVPHFKKLSMYSEWRQQDNKSDKLLLSAYNSQQMSCKYTTAGKITANLMVHSSYKFTVSEVVSNKDDSAKIGPIMGGYASTEEYTYIRGRGRGRYVCDQCGIRCKKPSMLKKHIRTHSNVRPYSCKHCNFSFKTKGNLTKHMKSKAHTKNYAASSSSESPVHQSGSLSSDSETDDSGMDSSDESSTRNQEHEAAYGLLSLSQKPSTTMPIVNSDMQSTSSPSHSPISATKETSPSSFMNTEQIVYVSKTNYAKNKILDQHTTNTFNSLKICDIVTSNSNSSIQENHRPINQYLGSAGTSRPLTYPYTSIHLTEPIYDKVEPIKVSEIEDSNEDKLEYKNIKHFNVIKRYHNPQTPTTSIENNKNNTNINTHNETIYNKDNNLLNKQLVQEVNYLNIHDEKEKNIKPISVIEQNDESYRKRKQSKEQKPALIKKQRNDEVMDLSMPIEKNDAVVKHVSENVYVEHKQYYQNIENNDRINMQNYGHVKHDRSTPTVFKNNENHHDTYNRININYVLQESPIKDATNKATNNLDYDNSAMETLADIATKQVKLEKNSVAKNVASEFLKLATKNDYSNCDDKTFISSHKDVNDMVGKNEENKSCTICSKNFNKPSQLRLHMNIHYLERPFRCDSCSVSFRTKGHLQKHERSASHHNKLSSSPALSSSEPRPFKCSDCSIAFRIHGHLAKHLRSKMHIMKLECLAKIPFGLYAELERSNSLLTEINTADGDQCLDSLKMLAKKVFVNDPSKLQIAERNTEQTETDPDS